MSLYLVSGGRGYRFQGVFAGPGSFGMAGCNSTEPEFPSQLSVYQTSSCIHFTQCFVIDSTIMFPDGNVSSVTCEQL